MTAEHILGELNFDEEVIAIFPYGSRVYGTANSKSDHDFIIVTKGAFLESNSIRDNAISNADKSLQAVVYSRSGFMSGIEKYEIGVWECLSLNEDDIVLMTPFFEKFVLPKMKNWNEEEMVKNIIKKASSSWYIAQQQAIGDFVERSKKGFFHALRILHFGLQLKEHKKIVDFSECNELFYKFKGIPADEFKWKSYISMRDELMEKLRA